MNKEEARKRLEEIKQEQEEAEKKLRKAESDFRRADIVLEMHQQGLRELKDEIEELQAIIDKPNRWQDGLVQPEKGRYFYLKTHPYSGLIVGSTSEVDRKPEYAFRTGEQAELIKEKILLMQEMHAFANVRNEGWLPDWENDEKKKYGLAINIYHGTYLGSYYSYNHFIFGIAVKSKEIANEMLEEFGERIEAIYNKQY